MGRHNDNLSTISNMPDTLAARAQALAQSAVLIDETERTTLVSMTGADTETLLQGVASQDVKALAAGRHAPALLLTPKGGLIADLTLFRLAPDSFLVACDALVGAKVAQKLARYVIAEDVTVKDVTAEYAILALRGPKAAALAGPEAAALAPGALAATPRGVIARSVTHGLAGVDLLLPRAAAEKERAALVAAGAVMADAAFADGLRVELGRVRCGKDVDETNLGPETRLETTAVSYTKGCYVGQETIARIKTYGQVNRLLVGLTFEGEPAREGDAITVDGKDVGRVTTVAFAPRLGRVAALAIVRREHEAPGTRVLAGAVPAVVAQLPLVS
jgi:folate-binding protein YgfZ